MHVDRYLPNVYGPRGVTLEITLQNYKRAGRFLTRLRGMGKNSCQSLEIFDNQLRHHSGPNGIVCAKNDI
jgi:hypothetical protein